MYRSVMKNLLRLRTNSQKPFINVETSEGMLDLWRIRTLLIPKSGAEVYEAAIGDGRLNPGHNKPMRNLYFNESGVQVDEQNYPVHKGLIIYGICLPADKETVINGGVTNNHTTLIAVTDVRQQVYVATIAAMVGSIHTDDDHRRMESLAQERGLTNSEWIAQQAMKQAVAAQIVWDKSQA